MSSAGRMVSSHYICEEGLQRPCPLGISVLSDIDQWVASWLPTTWSTFPNCEIPETIPILFYSIYFIFETGSHCLLYSVFYSF